MFIHGSASLQLFLVVWIFLRPLGLTCYNRWVVSEVRKKLLQGLMSHEFTTYLSIFILIKWIMVISSKGGKPDNFESRNSLKLNFTNIWGLCLNFVHCESFLESNSPDTLALCETDLDYSIDSGNFSVRGFLRLIRKHSTKLFIGMVLQFM